MLMSEMYLKGLMDAVGQENIGDFSYIIDHTGLLIIASKAIVSVTKIVLAICLSPIAD